MTRSDMSEDWRDQYRQRLVTAEEAARAVAPGSLLVFTSYEGEPTVMIDALIDEGVLASCRAFQSVRGTRGILAGDLGGFRLQTYSPGPAATAIAEGRADFYPGSSHTACRALEEGVIAPDVAIVNVSRPDADGYCSFGTSTDFASIATTRAPLVIAQANAAMPPIGSPMRLHVSDVDYFVEVDVPLPGATPPVLDEVSRRIGQFVAELVPDGSCIEVGIGAIPDAALGALAARTGLGLHSGLLTDGVMALYEAGVLTGENKEIDTGQLVVNQVHGTTRLYEAARDCPAVSMRSAAYTHDPRVMGQLSNFRALNSALQVDLRGQVNSEFLRGRQVAGTGGSLDFAVGASVSPGGRCIVALPSTSRDGRHSRIVAGISEGSVVTLPAVLVDYVVTEFGVASLRGRSLRDRRRELTAVAHPDFRQALAAQ